MKAIVVTGTPGTGKTTFAKKLAKDNNYKYIDVNEIIKLNNLCEEYDNQKDCIVVDETKLADVLVAMIKNLDVKLVIDSHMSHFIPKEYVEKCYVCKCNFPELKNRLEKRGYSENKIKDNLECEIFDVCLNEAKELGHDIKIICT